jgi:hypothetical protein
MGNYTVWPVQKSLKQVSKSFPFSLTVTDDPPVHLEPRRGEIPIDAGLPR